jgi:hypothetical protein
MTVPPGYLPIFGTVSVASVIGLAVLVMRLFADVKKATAEGVRKDDDFVRFLESRETALMKVIEREYVPRSEYTEHYARLKHMEASCPSCHPLKDTKAVRRHGV